MNTTTKFLSGFVVIVAGVVGTVSYNNISEVPNLAPNEVIQEVKVEPASIPEEIITEGGLQYRVVYMKTYKNSEGDVSELPQAGFELVTDKSQMIVQKSIIETEEERLLREENTRISQEEARKNSFNESIYLKIGELMQIKYAKDSQGIDSTSEQDQIDALKLQILN